MKKSVTFIAVSFFAVKSLAQIPSGYYNNAANKSCATLKTSLKTIITNGNTPQSYTALWSQYQISDVKPREVGSGSTNVIWDIYSDNPTGTDNYNFTPGNGTGGQQDQGLGGTAEGQYYNREHSVPRSWFNGNTGTAGVATDYMFIYPSDKYINGKRGNIPYGEVASASQTFLNGTKIGTSSVAGITGNVFEPIDSFKGDVARSFLYFVTRYEDNIPGWSSNADAVQTFDNSTFPSVTINYLRLMLKWNALDPVSAKEITRNNGAYNFQGNRNPFIDSPQFVNRVWNSTCPGLAALPIDIVFFEGKLKGTNINLNWETFNEINFSHFEVERGVNAINYQTIGLVNATGVNKYSFTDNIESLKGRRLYYRLKKVDKDGSYTYSSVFTIHVPLNIQFNIYPNPAKDIVFVQTNSNAINNIEVEITDITGKSFIKKYFLVENNGLIKIPVSQLSQGFYIIKLNYNGESFSKKIHVMK